MPYKLRDIETGKWHEVIEDLKSQGFEEVYRYGGFDAGIDYNRVELKGPGGGEPVVFEWDNWAEGEIRASESRLAALSEKYQLGELVDVDG